MDIPILLKGILLGFSIAAPVGPIGVLCIRRTLTSAERIRILQKNILACSQVLNVIPEGFANLLADFFIQVTVAILQGKFAEVVLTLRGQC
jgi:arginine exporter protein ArgO